MYDANRRKFLKFVAKASACAALSGSSALSGPQNLRGSSTKATAQRHLTMPEDITRTCIATDCARLALHSPTICLAFKRCLNKNSDDVEPSESPLPTFLEIFQLAGVVHSNNRFCALKVREFRDEWPGRKNDNVLENKLTFVLGSLCYGAADRIVYSDVTTIDSDGSNNLTDCSIYRDAFLIREMFALDRDAELKKRQIQGLLHSYWQRTLLVWHTFIPDTKDIDGWMERIFETHEQLHNNLSRYAEAICNPDTGKTKRFVDGPNFYDRRDPVIRLARSIQNGSVDKTVDLQKAIRAVGSQSLYAQALQKGYLYLQATSDYFDRRIDRASLFDQLDVDGGTI